MESLEANARDADGGVVAERAHTPAEPEQGVLELTILMPCLNEAETLAVCIKKAAAFLERSGISGEVVIADNGSTDGSQDIARGLGARVIDIPQRGYGAALMGGIQGAYGRYVIMGDSDDSYDFSSLDTMVAELRGGADVVMGNRFKGGIKPGAMPFLHRYLGNPVLSFIGRLFFGVPVGDFHCGLRGFRRDEIVKLNLRSTGMEFASEMVVKAKLQGLRFSEVPTTLHPDGRSRPPHLKTWRDGWRHLRFLLMYSPRWLFMYPGVVMILAGLAVAGLLLQGPVAIGSGVTIDIHSMLVACFSILIGLQLVLFSALARRYGEEEGFLPPALSFTKVMNFLTLERMLQIALVAFIVGAWNLWTAISGWAQIGFGDLDIDRTMRSVILGCTAIMFAVQCAATGFLVSIFRIRH